MNNVIILNKTPQGFGKSKQQNNKNKNSNYFWDKTNKVKLLISNGIAINKRKENHAEMLIALNDLIKVFNLFFYF